MLELPEQKNKRTGVPLYGNCIAYSEQCPHGQGCKTDIALIHTNIRTYYPSDTYKPFFLAGYIYPLVVSRFPFTVITPPPASPKKGRYREAVISYYSSYPYIWNHHIPSLLLPLLLERAGERCLKKYHFRGGRIHALSCLSSQCCLICLHIFCLSSGRNAGRSLPVFFQLQVTSYRLQVSRISLYIPSLLLPLFWRGLGRGFYLG